MSDKTICEKLLLKPGRSLCLLNEPAGFPNSLGSLPSFARFAETLEAADIAILFVRNLAELVKQLECTIARVHEGEILWIAYPKKSGKIPSDLDRDHLNLYLNTKGWQGSALIALDDDWAAMRVKRK